MKSEQFESTVLGAPHDYYTVSELPSGFRSYLDISAVYVRGLFYEEALALSRYVQNSTSSSAKDNLSANLSALVTIYRDVIKGVNIEDLEVSDFLALLTVSSIWTTPDFSWTPDRPCNLMKPNPLIADLERAILDSETPEERQALTLDLQNLDLTVPCDGRTVETITLDDLDFKPPLMISEVPLPFGHKDSLKDYLVKPITVGGILSVDKLLTSNSKIARGIAEFATMLVGPESLLEKVNIIRTAPPSQVHDLAKVESELHIKLDPVKLSCGGCGKKVEVNLGLDMLQTYP